MTKNNFRNRISEKLFYGLYATIHMGLQKRYSGTYFGKEMIIDFIKKWQIELFNERQVRLTPSITSYELLNYKTTEEHLAIRFVLLPDNFDKDFDFNEEMRNLTLMLMEKFDQNRMLLECNDNNHQFEQNDMWEHSADESR